MLKTDTHQPCITKNPHNPPHGTRKPSVKSWNTLLHTLVWNGVYNGLLVVSSSSSFAVLEHQQHQSIRKKELIKIGADVNFAQTFKHHERRKSTIWQFPFAQNLPLANSSPREGCCVNVVAWEREREREGGCKHPHHQYTKCIVFIQM